MKIFLFTLLTSTFLFVACSGKSVDCDAPISEGDKVTAEQIKCKLDFEPVPDSLMNLRKASGQKYPDEKFWNTFDKIGQGGYPEVTQEEKDWVEYSMARTRDLYKYEGFELIIEDKPSSILGFGDKIHVLFGDRVLCKIEDKKKEFLERYNLPEDSLSVNAMSKEYDVHFGTEEELRNWEKQNKDVLITLEAKYISTYPFEDDFKELGIYITFDCILPEYEIFLPTPRSLP